jgi:hypothetical protein
MGNKILTTGLLTEILIGFFLSKSATLAGDDIKAIKNHAEKATEAHNAR